MFGNHRTRLRRWLTPVRARPDRGAHTVEIMLWVAAFILIVSVAAGILRDNLIGFINQMFYDLGF